jgi:hypothetical protein
MMSDSGKTALPSMIVIEDTYWRQNPKPHEWSRTLQWVYPAQSSVTGERVWLKYYTRAVVEERGDLEEFALAKARAFESAIIQLSGLLDDAHAGKGFQVPYAPTDSEYPKYSLRLQRLGGNEVDWSVPIVPITKEMMVAHRTPWEDISYGSPSS